MTTPNSQNTQCPVCGHSVPSSTLILNPDLQPLQVTLFQRINPNWQEGEPVCPRCFDALLNTIDQAETQEERLNSQGHLRDYFRYVLTKRESMWWHHQNPELLKWKRGEIERKVEGMAREVLFNAWPVFDKDESLLVQGMSTDHLVE